MRTRKPAVKKTGKTPLTKRGRVYELTRKELLLWVGVAFFALVWMFTLGVIVGRGLSPVRFDVEKLKKELIALKTQALEKEAAAKRMAERSSVDKRHLGFYDVLTDKKEEARLKTQTKRKAAPVPMSEDTRASRTHAAVSKAGAARSAAGAQTAQQVSPDWRYTLQVGSLRDLAKAQKMAALLRDKGFDAYVVTASIPGKGRYHRVRVGRFVSRDTAQATAWRLKHENLEPIMVHR
ncbi:MAG: SPOR domain-containing protein [Deltaproteobacteria bacterium]|nr:SPOR domain-containing protein [Deltaproteobacteria bacterium]